MKRLNKFTLRTSLCTLASTLAIAAGSQFTAATAQTDAILVQSPVTPAVAVEEPYVPEADYDEYMRLGFAAEQEGDFVIAANYFRYALFAIPNDQAATTAYWNARSNLQTGTLSDTAIAYNSYMEAGYDATEEESYETALAYFQAALQLRPGDYYAAQAIRNVQTYVTRGAGADSPTDVPLTYSVYTNESVYDRYMRLGYAAAQREDFGTAREYFRSALYDRPSDRQATIAYWNAVDGIRDGEFGLNETAENPYDRFMRRGYDATERGNYAQAIAFFERALMQRPRDGYATQAIRNVRTYIQ